MISYSLLPTPLKTVWILSSRQDSIHSLNTLVHVLMCICALSSSSTRQQEVSATAPRIPLSQPKSLTGSEALELQLYAQLKHVIALSKPLYTHTHTNTQQAFRLSHSKLRTTHVYTYIQLCNNTYTHTYIRTYIHTYIHTYTKPH